MPQRKELPQPETKKVAEDDKELMRKLFQQPIPLYTSDIGTGTTFLKRK